MKTVEVNIVAFICIFNLCLAVAVPIQDSNDRNERKPYIVYMGELPGDGATPLQDQHHTLLTTAITDEAIARKSKIHSYGRSFNGFAARLLEHEAKALSEMDGVVSVFPNSYKKLHTTRSWDFMGMVESVGRKPEAESDIIVGVLDTGIYVKSPSFNDSGYGPPPPKWKGKCEQGANFTGCNRKVIGARCYSLASGQQEDEPPPSPADTDGHGTHTSSTAAGSAVHGANLYGLAGGTARGAVPSARIAMYKVCTSSGCSDIDILAAFDDAIADGVDVISISIGGPSGELFRDPIAIGSFHAMGRNVLTSCSAGNDGPSVGTVTNVAPWLLTVAATSTDRQFTTVVKLGDGQTLSGISLNTFSPEKKMYSLISGALASNASSGGSEYGNASACDWGTLSADKVKRRIVYCLGSSGQETNIKELGGAGIVTAVDPPPQVAVNAAIPGSYITAATGKMIEHYINSTANKAMAVIQKSRTTPIAAPFVASFSSRGPQIITKNILKPDISAPGLNILAAYTALTSLTTEPWDNRIAMFNIISGTSMACPHVTGAAAYVKTFRPGWSPAAIKSALMTTATPMKIKAVDGELGSGSGQIDPTKAIHPGLVYDASFSSYISFLCRQGYNGTTIGLLAGGGKAIKCSDFRPAEGTDGLNYPSMHLQLQNPKARISAVFHRTVTNVGSNKSVYKAKVTSPEGLSVTVTPNTLAFDRPNVKKDFRVVLKGKPSGSNLLSALLEWTDGIHSVRSPIVVCNMPAE